ncbi:DUF541 domain-containing protein [Rhodohalobacter sp. SW132]|uniref:SIMPL domain-containing protein n=1 Tax=Rhodohalobacter sp. SW132 TaxID=2293433 RepID=UPI000E238EAD|nr:SIMPL domain-containing protein [Rhodohalobacter sp. SW132]REL38017.1 DUF541 domain-containing protein [Rhodohalobacter sp. SW132]
MKRSVIVLTLFGILLAANSVTAQNYTDSHTLTIHSTGEANTPADIAFMSVNISINHEDADRAFELHRERESFLADLLKELEIEDDQINYRPATIRPNRQRDGEIHSVTSQQIRIQLDEIRMLGELQRTLIQNGFDNFSGNLSSTKMEEAGDEALREAVKNARKDAEILALASDREIGKIIRIEHSSDQPFRSASVSEAFQARAMSDSGPSMFDFSQTVSVQKRVTVIFELLE